MLTENLVTVVLGTRPEAIKLAPLIIAFRKSNNFITRVILTGQHKEMVDQVMQTFEIEYDLNINLMRHNQSLSHISNSVMNGLEREFQEFNPNLLIVQGDTSTAFTAALTAFYHKIPVAHVEAGLRTNDLINPFPEEANRRLISQISSLHFAPTEETRKNLKNSGVCGKVFVTGNTVIDALKIALKKKINLPTNKIEWSNYDVIFATIHRRENWGENIKKISKALLKIINSMPNVALVIPLHPNPKVRNPLKKLLSNHPRIELIEPLDYLESISCMKESKLVLTDSGGIQEEAPSLSKPVLVLRKNTERVEGLKAGTIKIIGTETQTIYDETVKLLSDKNQYFKMANAKNPYGDGNACEKILIECEKFLNNKTFQCKRYY